MDFHERLRLLITEFIESWGTEGIREVLASEISLIRDNQRDLWDSDDAPGSLAAIYRGLCDRVPELTN